MVAKMINTVGFLLLVAHVSQASPYIKREITNIQFPSTFPPRLESIAEDLVEAMVEDAAINKKVEEILSRARDVHAHTGTVLTAAVDESNEQKIDKGYLELQNNEDKDATDTRMTDETSSPEEKDIVIRTQEDEELMPSEGGVSSGTVVRRVFNQMFVEPVRSENVVTPIKDEYRLNVVDDDMDAAATLVFRPFFRYDKSGRRRG